MTTTTTMSFQVGTSDPTVKLGFEAWVNDQKLFGTDHVQSQQQISLEIPDDDGTHELRLVMKGKTPQHTKIDELGNIVSDAVLTVDNLAFDEIQLGHMTTELAVYTHDFNGTDQPSQHKFYSEMGCTGTVSLQFSTPVYMWLLEHM